jgi:hypothetical protein
MKAANAAVTNQSQCGYGEYGKLAAIMVRTIRILFFGELSAIV